MSDETEEPINYYRELLRPIYKSRKLMHVSEIDVSMIGVTRTLEELGAARPLLIAGNHGTSATKFPDDLDLITLGAAGGRNMVESTRLLERSLADLPPEIHKRIQQWDPEYQANWVCTGMLGEITTIAGRCKYGKRKPEWTALEDKTTIDAFWDLIGVQHAPSKVVGLDEPRIREIAIDLDSGLGTVWSAGNRDGVHGGSIGIRWAKQDSDVNGVIGELREISKNVRIAPFLEGVPMSIHGVVFPESVAVFRPVELITLRFRDKSRFLWGGCSTGYDPSTQDRHEIREVARHTGDALRNTVNFRGPFSIDGILTHRGFMPTELNPRMSGGFGPLTRGIPDLPFAPLCWAAMESEELDYRPDLLEQTVIQHADSERVLRGNVVTSRAFTETIQLSLVRDGQEFKESIDDDPSAAKLTCGPSPTGGIIFLQIDAGVNSPGTFFAPEMLRALHFCDKRFGTNFGKLDCAEEVRRVD